MDPTDNESNYSELTNRSERSKHRRHRSPHDRSNKRHRSRGEKIVTIRTPPLDTSRNENNRSEDVHVDMPQDDNWGETNTFISGTTDVTNLSHESLAKFRKDIEASIGFRDFGFVATVILAFISFVTPIAFVVLPLFFGPGDTSCATPCQGLLISMSFKLLILLIGSWALFFRRPRANMPRVFLFRAMVMGLVLIITLTYWLFYGVRILDKSVSDDEVQYKDIVEYAETLTNCLLFIHYLAVVLLEVRQLQTSYIIEVIRSTDGERRFYNIGELSIQRTAVWVLEQYYRDFPVYNPALLHIPSRSARMKQLTAQNFKVYDVDGPSNDTQAKTRAMMAAVARRRDAGHNERYYEEAEYERRIRKRRARLIAATEDAFTHIRRANEQDAASGAKSSNEVMNPDEASQAIFPALARALQKYLRTTRQHQHYQIEDILKHLGFCIKNDMTPKAFLERYIHPGSLMTYDQQQRESTSWQLVSDEPLVNSIKDNTVIRLSQPEYSLIMTVRKSPRIRLQEDYVEPSSHRFVLRLQSETSV
ncbi:vang-like protein 2 isoform X2 [Styela clava]|uniref:vang-like protein 2 isoform X2 n=1 Tax=Styela clava TaxID=7725 RepID=UPI001939A2BC|nr:vang-like protein 2 isoform X2 [Styela clava]